MLTQQNITLWTTHHLIFPLCKQSWGVWWHVTPGTEDPCPMSIRWPPGLAWPAWPCPRPPVPGRDQPRAPRLSRTSSSSQCQVLKVKMSLKSKGTYFRSYVLQFKNVVPWFVYCSKKWSVTQNFLCGQSGKGHRLQQETCLTLPHTSNKRKKILGQHSAETRKNLIFWLCSGMPQMPQSVPLDPTLQFVSGSGEVGDTTSSQVRGSERSRGGGGAASPGGGPLRNTSFPFPFHL